MKSEAEKGIFKNFLKTGEIPKTLDFDPERFTLRGIDVSVLIERVREFYSPSFPEMKEFVADNFIFFIFRRSNEGKTEGALWVSFISDGNVEIRIA